MIESQSVCDPTTARASNVTVESAPQGTDEERPGTRTQHSQATYTYSPPTSPMEARNDSTPDQALVIEITSKHM